MDLLNTLRPAHGFSLANITASPIMTTEWAPSGCIGDDNSGALEIEPVYPEVTAQRARAILEDHGIAPEREDGESDEDYAERCLEDFEGSDAESEWCDGFFPMMNAAWPVDLAYGADPETVAGRIDDLAGAVSLVRVESENFPTEYALALTGGGMDLTDHLIRAYVCCGSVPPLDLMRFENWAWESKGRDWLPVLEDIAERARDWLDNRAERIGDDLARFKAGLAEKA